VSAVWHWCTFCGSLRHWRCYMALHPRSRSSQLCSFYQHCRW
jgi:hypothetical protein